MPRTETVRRAAGGFDTTLIQGGPPDGEPVLFVHNTTPGVTAATGWGSFASRLSDEFRVLAPDLVGHGATTCERPVRTGLAAWTRTRVAQVLALLDELSVNRVHVVAAALAAPLALHLVSADPDRFVGVCLVGALGGKTEVTPEFRACMSFYEDPCVEAISNLVLWSYYDAEQVLPSLNDVVRALYSEAMRPEVRGAFESCYGSSRVAEQLLIAPAALRRIGNPVLLVHGREDRFARPSSAFYLQQHLPNASLHLLPNVGHALATERVDELERLLRTYLHDL